MKRCAVSLLSILAFAGSTYHADASNPAAFAVVGDDPATVALEVACDEGNLKQVDTLVGQGAPVNGVAEKIAPLP